MFIFHQLWLTWILFHVILNVFVWLYIHDKITYSPSIFYSFPAQFQGSLLTFENIYIHPL